MIGPTSIDRCCLGRLTLKSFLRIDLYIQNPELLPGLFPLKGFEYEGMQSL